MLRAADVSFAYRDREVLHGVTLEVPRQGLVGLLGPNGSGKTTLLRLLSGVLTPTAGTVTLGDAALAAIPRRELARLLAVVPQETQLAFDYTVLDIALMGRYPHLGAFELEGPDDVALARRALAATGTLDLMERTFTTLSAGEKQRVVIASALAQFEEEDPVARHGRGTRTRHDHHTRDDRRILLLDEPTAALDVRYQVELAALLQHLNAVRGVTIAVSTHDLNFAASLCTSLVLLRDGRVLDAGPIAEVLSPERVHALYGVEVDVRFHEAAGHLTVVPVGRPQATGWLPS